MSLFCLNCVNGPIDTFEAEKAERCRIAEGAWVGRDHGGGLNSVLNDRHLLLCIPSGADNGFQSPAGSQSQPPIQMQDKSYHLSAND